MFNNVLVGVDGRQGGRDAIALARNLAGPEADLTLAHVYASDWMLGRGGAIAAEAEHLAAQELLERERSAVGVDADAAVIGVRPVGQGLHELAEDRGADLLVVGSCRHALLGRVMMGDDARAALDGASCAVAVATRGYKETADRFTTIGVGYDGSPESAHALSAAHELGQLHHAKVKAFSVVSLQDVKDDHPIPADWPATVEKLLMRRREWLAKLDDVEGVASYGGTREELARLGRDVDLLIVGSRGYGPLGRLFHGSVSSYLVKHAPRPLLVLPRPQAAAVTDEGAITASA